VEGAVENPLSFQLSHFNEYETTIAAELKGKISYVPSQEYTGIPVQVIIKEASPLEGAEKLHVIASDGYEVEFDLEEVLLDDQMILIEENDMLRLIAGNYGGEYWVKQVSKMVVQ
jgi:DMSO/TMAO reductase YedYZ molybdopterin-dependent catalytic subunit